MIKTDDISKIKINNKFSNRKMPTNVSKKPKRKSLLGRKYGLNCFINTFTEFCQRTDFHGYKYIVMKELTLMERVFWGVAVVVSIATAAFFVISAYNWYSRNPIITVIESTHNSIWDVPFPSVTVCSLNLISRKAARDFADQVNLPPGIEPDQVFAAARVVPVLYAPYPLDGEQAHQAYIMKTVMDYNNISIIDIVQTLSPIDTCNSLVQRCMWKNTIYRCELMFRKIIMQYGICCTFNYYAISDNDMNELYNPSLPRRVASCGYQTALSLLLQIQPEDYYSALLASIGALVIVDNAYNYPDVNSPAHGTNPSTEVFISISPESTYATSGIRSFTFDKRECYFDDEVKIDKFSVYTYHNCILHRKVHFVKKKCDCVPLYYPTAGNIRYCGFEDIECLMKLHNSTYVYDTEDTTIRNLNCLPDCTHFDYPLDVAVGLLAKDVDLSGLAFFKDIDLRNQSIVNVFFNDLVSTRYRRDVYLNWQNLLASFGGLLSLMLGFTLISALDFVIFVFVRIVSDPIKHKNKIFVKPNTRGDVSKISNTSRNIKNDVETNNWVSQNIYMDDFVRNKY